jgi:hypothetical protein
MRAAASFHLLDSHDQSLTTSDAHESTWMTAAASTELAGRMYKPVQGSHDNKFAWRHRALYPKNFH